VKSINIDKIIKSATIFRLDHKSTSEHSFFESYGRFDKEVYGDFPYQKNSFNIVGEDIACDAEVVALGCSVTASVGIPHQLTWPYMLQQITGNKVNVVAQTGLNIINILELLAGYLSCKDLATPKQVYILMPDIFRTHITDLKTMHTKHLEFNPKAGFTINNKRIAWLNDTYLKKYFPSVEYKLHDTIKTLELCLAICKSLGVEVTVSSWDLYTQNIFYNLGYIKGLDSTGCFNYEDTHWSFEAPCGKHAYDIPDHLKYFWDSAVDTQAHPGLHHHLHYTESLLDISMEENFLSTLDYNREWIDFL